MQIRICELCYIKDGGEQGIHSNNTRQGKVAFYDDLNFQEINI